MIATVISAAVTCVAALVLGQTSLRACGARRWSWLAPAVGVSILMLVAVPAIHLPGRVTADAVVLLVLVAASVAWLWRDRAHWPAVGGLLAAVPVALLTLVPFLTAGRAGTLGVGFDNDMAGHLLLAEAYLSPAVAHVTPLLPSYPIGPHAFAAVLAGGLGIGVDHAFAGFTMSVPVLAAWTALAALRRSAWWGRVIVATVVGLPYLVAAYYGEGAFKELLQTLFVLAFAILLDDRSVVAGRLRWVPFALLAAGMISVYSIDGLPWPIMILGLWGLGVLAGAIARGRIRGLAVAVRRALPAVALALGVLIVVLIPQLRRIDNFLKLDGVAPIPKGNLGNLAGPLPAWEGFGIWNSPDFRFAGAPFSQGMWTAFALALVVFGAGWCVARRRYVLVAAAGASLLIWSVTAHSQSPYVAAKALVIASPMLLLLAVLPLVEGPRVARWWWLTAPALAVVLFVRVADSDLQVLRSSSVGPTNHLYELRTLRAQLHGQPTLFLGVDDFIDWELAGVPVTAPVIGFPLLPFPPQKSWMPGSALDFDSVSATTLNANDWVITTRDAAASQAPAGERLVRVTRDYELWQRVGVVQPRGILAEGSSSGAVLDCATASGRQLSRTAGVAAVRRPSIGVSVPAILPGGSVSVTLALSPGAWDLDSNYTSTRPIVVGGGGGLATTLPANLDRVGALWPVGRVVQSGAQPIIVTFTPTKRVLTPPSDAVPPQLLVATPVGSEHLTPLRQACGQYIDWYRVR